MVRRGQHERRGGHGAHPSLRRRGGGIPHADAHPRRGLWRGVRPRRPRRRATPTRASAAPVAGSGDWRLAFESDARPSGARPGAPARRGARSSARHRAGHGRGGLRGGLLQPREQPGIAEPAAPGQPLGLSGRGDDCRHRRGRTARRERGDAAHPRPGRVHAQRPGAGISARGGTPGRAWAAETLAGALGDGAGKWRLMVTSDQPLSVMSLLASAAGHLTNLSSVPAGAEAGVHRLALLPPANDAQRQGFVRLVNRDARAGTVTLRAFDDAGTPRTPCRRSPSARARAVGFSARRSRGGPRDPGPHRYRRRGGELAPGARARARGPRPPGAQPGAQPGLERPRGAARHRAGVSGVGLGGRLLQPREQPGTRRAGCVWPTAGTRPPR